MAISDWPGKLLWLTNTIGQVTDALKKHGEVIEKLKSENNALKERLVRLEERLEAREEVILEKAKGAAGAAAQQVALASVSGIYSRLAALEAVGSGGKGNPDQPRRAAASRKCILSDNGDL